MSLWRKRQIEKDKIMVTIDWDTADRITVQALTQHKELLATWLHDYEKGEKWMHPDDVKYNKKMVKYMTRIIEYFGGTDEP